MISSFMISRAARERAENDAVIAQFITLLDAGQRAGIWRFPNARVVALIVFHGMHGVVDDAIASGRRDAKPLVKLLSEAFSRMLKE
jgi:hypothetical protein